jgi:hypothetical protein
MECSRRGPFWRRSALIILIGLLATAFGTPPARGCTNDGFHGLCGSGDPIWFVDCTCDNTGCEGGPPGPAYWACAYQDCSRMAFGLPCDGDFSSYATAMCVPVTSDGPGCSCHGFQCLFAE